MTLLEAARQALEFLSHAVAEDWPDQKRKDAVCDALRVALAKPNRAEKMRAAGYTRRPTLRELAYSQTTHWEGCESVHPECKKPEQTEQQEPVATKQMLRWVEHLKRLSDDGQHMSIPGLSSGVCWELAIELEQFIKNTTPPQRKPLTDEEIDRVTDQQWASNNHKPIYAAHRAYARAIERAHGIKEKNT